MKINSKILNIPPYISTTWDNVNSIYTENDKMIIILKNSTRIEIPNLEDNIVKEVFNAHAQSLESKQPENKAPVGFNLPMFSNSGGIESFTSAMQHNPNQKDAPDLPKDMIKKIASLAKLFSEENAMEFPKPEPDCNCMHCQIAKALQIGTGINLENLDDEVNEEDLKFRLWDIEESGEKLFTVTNPLDQNEHYNVYLGEPIGCTCGRKNCEHIKAVLST